MYQHVTVTLNIQGACRRGKVQVLTTFWVSFMDPLQGYVALQHVHASLENASLWFVGAGLAFDGLHGSQKVAFIINCCSLLTDHFEWLGTSKSLYLIVAVKLITEGPLRDGFRLGRSLVSLVSA